jgi:hypothetical protein
MAQPVWQTAAGSLGVIPEGVFYQQTLVATDADLGPVTYSVIAGALPAGVQCTPSGQIVGVPTATASLQGVPTSVNQDVTSKFVVRASATGRIADRTFTLTVTGNDVPLFETPAGSIGTFYDGDLVNIQIQYSDDDPEDNTVVTLASGLLPPGLTVSPTGLIYGYIRPATPLNQTPGYDESAADQEPYDFVVDFVSRNYQFTLEVNDGKSNDLRQFTMFVYSRNEMTADTTQITADNDFVTADETNNRAPFLTNAVPSDLGRVRSDNYFSYRFIGDDYDTQDISYAISVNTGFGLPPGLELDPATGWLYGELPDQGTTEVEYSFNITVYQTQPVESSVFCISTESGTNRITCTSTESLGVGEPLKLSGSALGGVSLAANTLYYVRSILNPTQFTITASPNSTSPVALTNSLATIVDDGNFVPAETYVIVTIGTSTQADWNAIAGTTNTNVGNLVTGTSYVITSLGSTSQTVWNNIANTTGVEYKVGDTFVAFDSEAGGGTGTVNVIWNNGDVFVAATSGTGIGDGTAAVRSSTLVASPVIASQPFPFTLTVVGAVDSEITWLTDSDLGVLVNGETSLLRVEAVNRGGRELQYRLASGEFNSLPQGLELLPSGEIAGRVTFNTFAIDLGTTTFDSNETIWDSEFDFVVNAYAPDTQQLLYNVSEIQVVDGGSGYNSSSPPTIVFETPVGASAVQALAGNVTIVAGAITAVQVSNSGAGYTGPATITITEGFGGSGGELTSVMQVTGTRDVVSVFKSFSVRVVREYNAPYQNLYVQAMPPEQDRLLIDSLLNNQEIFVPDYIYRPTDPNFGLSTRVTYQHAFGLAPDSLDTYVASLYLNHYWKNLVLGSVETAQALDSNGNVVYEVVYSRIIDNLVNDAGESVAKIVPLPYAITDPADGSSEIREVYPNSLINMRDQVIDTVGQISTGLPLWMTSKQTDGRVLGFTPAWVIAYVNPGRGRQIAYYLQTQFGQQLNKVDFKVDRYILDRSLSLNWDTATQDWTPQPSLTTFDRFDTSGFEFYGNVSIATNLAYADVNERTLDYINNLGGLDGEISQINGDTIVFVKQEDYTTPGGSSYSTVDAAWQEFITVYDVPEEFDKTGFEYDESYTISGGEEIECVSTNAANGRVTYVNTTGSIKVYPNLPITLTTPIGGLSAGLHVVLTTPSLTTFTLARAATVTQVEGSTDLITISSASGFSVGSAVTFYPTVFGGLVAGTTYYILTITTISGGGAQITVSLTPSGTRETLSSAVGTCIMRGTQLTLTNATGTMTAFTYNERLAVYQITVDPVTTVVRLNLVGQTAAGDFVQVQRGSRYRSAQLYIPNSPGTDLTRISWLPLTTVVTPETTFDQGSVEFIEPVDMYNPGEINDKYLVFPKTNILV